MDTTQPKLVDLGSGTTKPEGYIGIDKVGFDGVDHVIDLDSPTVRLPFDDDSIDAVRASHFLEHIQHIYPLMNEVWRILRFNGMFDIYVPLAPSRAAFDDPDHKRFFTKGTFHYFTRKPPGNYTNPAIDGKYWYIVKNDWTPMFQESGDSIIIPDVRELHVILQPLKRDESYYSNPNTQ